MDTTVNNLIDAINKDIREHKEVADKAMEQMEMMNCPSEAYKEENLRFSLNQYIIGFLRNLRSRIFENKTADFAERLIRFHAYTQRKKGNMADGSDISIAQSTVTVTLDAYISTFFEPQQ